MAYPWCVCVIDWGHPVQNSGLAGGRGMFVVWRVWPGIIRSPPAQWLFLGFFSSVKAVAMEEKESGDNHYSGQARKPTVVW